MPKNPTRSVSERLSLLAVREARERRQRLQATLILGGGLLLLLGLICWAISSGGREWRGWLGSLRNKAFGEVGNTLGEDTAPGTGGGSAAFGEKGRAALGIYNVHRFDPITNTTLTVNFELSGQTACNDKASFDDFMQTYLPFFREQVIGAVRDCDTGDLADKPGLARKLVARVNRALGRRFLKSVEFEQMQMFETVGPYEGESWEPPKGE